MISACHETYMHAYIYIMLFFRPWRRANCPDTETMYQQPCMKKKTTSMAHLYKTHSLRNPSAAKPLAQPGGGMAPLL